MEAVYLSSGNIELRKVPIPEPPLGESLVKVLLAGICDTDLQLRAGYMDFEGIPGHEFVGTVVGGDNKNLIGKRVVGEINASCGHCTYCHQGLGRHCPTRTVLGILNRSGAHSQYFTLPHRNMRVVPESLANEDAVFVEPLAAACEILEQVHIQPNHRVAVVGDGKLGLLVAQVLALTGCNLKVFGRHFHKLSLLEDRGIDVEVVPPEGDSTLPGGWADIAVECTGSQSGFEVARRFLKPRGTLVLKSTYKGNPEIFMAGLVIDEITLIGSRCGPYRPALRLLEEGLVEVEKLIHHRYPLSKAKEAYQKASEKGVLKVLLEMEV